ncbi:CFAB factor, partial [Polypterus senegalus]|nr:CFAB factor [Polypterus senegalus]
MPERKCERTGQWTRLKTFDGVRYTRTPECKHPSGFQHGSLEPSQPLYYIGDTTTYQCYEGYELYGSASRTCQPNGKWSGSTPICIRKSDEEACTDPGVPAGSIRTGNNFDIDDKVTYECARGLIFFGSKVRICQESGEWTGSEPACYYPYTYDTPEEAASKLGSSLNALLEVSNPEKPNEKKDHGRKIILKQNSILHIYIVLDTSDSVQEDFEKSKECVMDLMDKISAYEVSPKYGILSFASTTITVVDIADKKMDPAQAIQKLEEFKSTEHLDQTGTNIKGAMDKVYEMMSAQKATLKNFNEVRNVIILLTDGHVNMGGDPYPTVRKIQYLVGTNASGDARDEYLDIYGFGVGTDVDKELINKLTSKKNNENHYFLLQSPELLRETFDKMIDESDSVALCGLYKDTEEQKLKQGDYKRQEHYPWHVSIQITRQGKAESCKGSIVGNKHVLTAAHCFTTEDDQTNVKVLIDDKDDDQKRSKDKKVKAIHLHPNYSIYSKKNQGIDEFYDYDIAVIELNETLNTIKISPKARPICIPCTEESRRALRLKPEATCKDQIENLFSQDIVDAFFVTGIETQMKNMNVKIKLKNQPQLKCNEDALKAPLYTKLKDWRAVVTDRFLCTGGTDPEIDEVTCKGDSGGSLVVKKKRRAFQVGVISWGNKNLCQPNRKSSTPDSRDYYINLLKFIYGNLTYSLQSVYMDGETLPDQHARNTIPVTCSVAHVGIKGGSFHVVGTGFGSKLRYVCPENEYPHPMQIRICERTGQWTRLKTIDGSDYNRKPECKQIICPDPLGFEHGSVEPADLQYYIGQTTTYQCFDGYVLHGSESRTCQPHGKWNGTTPICVRRSEEEACTDPGVPAGSTRTGDNFDIDDKVTYECKSGMILFGSKERVCLESGEWTGSEPACYFSYTYDTSDEAASKLGSSLNALLEVSDPEKPNIKKDHSRRIILKQGSTLHIYIVLDTSESVHEEFEKSKESIMDLMDKISAYEVSPKYAIFSFASKTITVVDIADKKMDPAQARQKLEDFQATEHEDQTGTNIRGAMEKVYVMISAQKATLKDFDEVRNVIILITDGRVNMGGDPYPVVRQIQYLVGTNASGDARDEYLDIYVFGVGDVDKDTINKMASHKTNEEHAFVLNNHTDLKETFEKMIEDDENSVKVKIDDRDAGNPDKPIVKSVASILVHPKYNIHLKKNEGIPEFYDYDIAIIVLKDDDNNKIKFSQKARPICVPCTEESRRALRLQPGTSCKDQMDVLFLQDVVDAFFVTTENNDLKNMNVKIKLRNQPKRKCNEDALKATVYSKVKDWKEVVTERFLCTGGIEPETDEVTCKGQQHTWIWSVDVSSVGLHDKDEFQLRLGLVMLWRNNCMNRR